MEEDLNRLMQECVAKRRGPQKFSAPRTPERTRKEVTLNTKKKEALVAARELGYPKHIQERIENAQNEAQIQNALVDGRHEMIGYNDVLDQIQRKKRKGYYRNAK